MRMQCRSSRPRGEHPSDPDQETEMDVSRSSVAGRAETHLLLMNDRTRLLLASLSAWTKHENVSCGEHGAWNLRLVDERVSSSLVSLWGSTVEFG